MQRLLNKSTFYWLKNDEGYTQVRIDSYASGDRYRCSDRQGRQHVVKLPELLPVLPVSAPSKEIAVFVTASGQELEVDLTSFDEAENWTSLCSWLPLRPNDPIISFTSTLKL
jgi:hypothetical protein